MRRWISRNSSFGATPKARAIRERLPVTLPTSCCRSGPAASNSTARGFPSSACATSASSVAPLRTLQLLGGKLFDEPAQPEAIEIARPPSC